MVKGRTKRELRANRDGLLFALPWIIGFLVFSLYPITMSLYYSFTEFSAVKDPVWVGMNNFKELFRDADFYKSLKNTLVFVGLSVPATIILSLIVAMLLKIVPIGQTFFRGIFYIPTIFPAVASAMIWILLFDYKNGYLNRLLGMFGVSKLNWLGNPELAKPSLVLMACWGIGTTVVIFIAAMGEVPSELYESANIDGAGVIRQFLHITIPGIAHVLLYQVVLAIISGFQYMTQVYIFVTVQSGTLNMGTKAGPKNSLLVYPLYLFQNAFTHLKMGKASAMAWILFIIIAALTYLLVKGSKKWVHAR